MDGFPCLPSGVDTHDNMWRFVLLAHVVEILPCGAVWIGYHRRSLMACELLLSAVEPLCRRGSTLSDYNMPAELNQIACVMEPCQRRTRVDAILTYNGKLVGVRTNTGEAMLADVVVCNRDLPAAYELLDLPYGQRKAKDLGRKEYSAAVVAFNWAVDGTFPKLLQHNVFLSEQFRQSWRRPAKPMDFVRWPNFYVHVPNRTDPTAAPRGGDAITVLLPVANAQEMARRGVWGKRGGGGVFACVCVFPCGCVLVECFLWVLCYWMCVCFL